MLWQYHKKIRGKLGGGELQLGGDFPPSPPPPPPPPSVSIPVSAVHLPGTANSLADALSHNNPPSPFSVPITHRQTPIPAPVIDLLAHSKTQLDCSTLYSLTSSPLHRSLPQLQPPAICLFMAYLGKQHPQSCAT